MAGIEPQHLPGVDPPAKPPGELDQVRGHAQAEGQGLLHHDVGACFQSGADALRVLVLGHNHIEEVDPAGQQGVNR